MKNLKKLMSVILTVAMLLSMVATSVGAATFTDVEEDNVAYEAIEVMAALKILEGKEEGNFDPEANIKRSEFAAVICRAMNQEAAAAGSASVAKFSDVAAGHWAAGYINWAAGQGIVNGMGDGTFAPDANVTYEQAVAMIVRAMGFEPLALKRGGFPTGYMVVAAGYKVTDGVAMAPANGAATRAGVAQLVYNALDAATMEEGFGVNIYGGTVYNIYDGKENDKATLLSKYHNILAIDAYVKDTFNSKTGLLDTRKGEKKIELAPVYEYDEEGKIIGANDFTADQIKDAFGYSSLVSEGEAITFKPIVADEAFGNYLGYYVKAFLTVNDDDKLVVVAMVPDKDVDTITINNVKANIKAAAVASDGKISFEFYEDEDYLNDDLEFVKLSGLTIYKNGEEVTTNKKTTFEGIAGNADYAQVVLLGNDEVYSKVFITEYTYKIVESVNTETGRVKFKEGSGLTLKDNDDIYAYSIYKDGEAIALEDLAEGDLLNYFKISAGDGKDRYEFHVTSDVVEGTLSYFDPTDSVYTIEGEEYVAVNQTTATEPEWNPGSTGKFYITIDGRIYDAEITSGFDGNYAFILNGGLLDIGGASDGCYELRVLTKDNVVDVYEVASNLKVWDTYDGKYTSKTYTMSGTNKQDTLFDETNGKIGKEWAKNNSGSATEANIANLFVTVKIENDKITTISFPAEGQDFNSKPLTNAAYNEDKYRLDGDDVTESTVVFAVELDDTTKKVTEDTVQVYTISRLNDNDKLYGSAYAIDKEGEIGALAITKGLTDLMDANALALVSGISQGLNNGEPASILNVYVGGELVGYPVSDKYTAFADLELAKGDVIQLNLNAAKEVDKVQPVYDYGTTTLADLNEDGDEYLFYAGVVTDNKKGLVIKNADDTTDLRWDLSEASTNLLVDIAKWGRSKDIVAKSDFDHIEVDIEDSKFVTDAYVVVVRTNEDKEIIDVVTYKYENYENKPVTDLSNTILVD